MRTWNTKVVYHITSEPGDLTRYDYLMAKDGPDEFIFAPFRNTFRYPQRLNYWNIKDVSSIEECIPIAEKENCNPHTVLECINAIKESASIDDAFGRWPIAINQAIEALTMAHDYINDGSLLPQDMKHPYFKTDAAIELALRSLGDLSK